MPAVQLLYLNIAISIASFLLPGVLILVNISGGGQGLAYVLLSWLCFVAGYSFGFLLKIRHPVVFDIQPGIAGVHLFLMVIMIGALLYKVAEVGLPGDQFSGRAYEAAFMGSGSVSTILFLFMPVLAALYYFRFRRRISRMVYLVVVATMLLVPGIKGNAMVFICTAILAMIFRSKLSMWRLSLFVVAMLSTAFTLFYVSHFVVRGSMQEGAAASGFVAVWDLMVAYIYPNFLNLNLTVTYSDIYQYGGVILLPLIENVTLGTVRTISAVGQTWYFYDPALKAGTFARDLWQDFGWFGPVAAFALSVLWGSVQFTLYRFETRFSMPPVMTALMSYPIVFMFFYNEFNRPQVVFGVVLLMMCYVFSGIKWTRQVTRVGQAHLNISSQEVAS